MDLEALLVALVVGAVTGWTAFRLIHGTGLGLWADALIGIIGALFASIVLPRVGLDFGIGLPPKIIVAALGAAISLLIVYLIDCLLADAE